MGRAFLGAIALGAALAGAAAAAGCSSSAMTGSFGDMEGGTMEGDATGEAAADGAAADGAAADGAAAVDGGDMDGAVADVGPADAPSSGVCDAPGMIFSTTCATTLCHTAVDLAGNLDLGSPGLDARLVDKPASGGPGKLIDSTNPAQSVLYRKVTSTPPFGAQMPYTRPPLSAANMQCIHDWVFAQVAAPGGG